MKKKERKRGMRLAAGNAKQFAKHARTIMRHHARLGHGTATQLEAVADMVKGVAVKIRELEAKHEAASAFESIAVGADGSTPEKEENGNATH